MYIFEVAYSYTGHKILPKKSVYVECTHYLDGEKVFSKSEMCTLKNHKWLINVSFDLSKCESKSFLIRMKWYLNICDKCKSPDVIPNTSIPNTSIPNTSIPNTSIPDRSIGNTLDNCKHEHEKLHDITLKSDTILDMTRDWKFSYHIGNVLITKYYEPYCKRLNIHPNQYQCGSKILNEIKKGCHHIVMIAQMQMGKTGASKSLAYQLQYHGYKCDDIYFICGMNDNNLLNQSKNEFKSLIPSGNIYFSKQIQKLLDKSSDDDICDKFKNCVIFVDESHYASHKGSLIDKFFKKIGITGDGQYVKWSNKSIVLVSISATPMAEIANVDKHHTIDKQIVYLEGGKNYYGISDMYSQSNIKQSYNLNKSDETIEFIKMVTFVYNKQMLNKKFRYCIVRLCSNSQHMAIQKQLASVCSDITFINYYSSHDSVLKDFNEYVKYEPKSMTIIWIYDTLRAGKQLDTTNIEFVHDTHGANPDVVAQGLVGRLCGYGKKTDVLCYTNVKSVIKFIDWVEHGYSASRIPNGCKDIVNGFDAYNIPKWETNIPICFNLDDTLIDICQQYREQYGKKRYGKEFKDKCVNYIINAISPMQSDGKIGHILKTYFPPKNGGLMLIDDNNKQSSVTKHWDTNYQASINGKNAHGFVALDDEKHDRLYYIFLNLVTNHRAFGKGLICYKKYIEDTDEIGNLVSSHPDNFYTYVDKS
jgi:hypothetical protein